MPQNHPGVHVNASLIGVQVRPADIRSGDLDDGVERLLDTRIRNVLDSDLEGPSENNSFPQRTPYLDGKLLGRAAGCLELRRLGGYPRTDGQTK